MAGWNVVAGENLPTVVDDVLLLLLPDDDVMEYPSTSESRESRDDVKNNNNPITDDTVTNTFTAPICRRVWKMSLFLVGNAILLDYLIVWLI